MSVYTSKIIYDGKAYNTTEDCLNICQYSDFNEILELLLDEKQSICNIILPSCIEEPAVRTTGSMLQLLFNEVCKHKVQISVDDDCPGYLSDKITTSDDSIIKTVNTDENGCQTIDLKVRDSLSVPPIVLYHNLDTNSTSLNNTDIQSYTLPANTLSKDGDVIKVEAFVYGGGHYVDGIWLLPPANASIYIAGLEVIDLFYEGHMYEDVYLSIIRKNDTTIRVSGIIHAIVPSNALTSRNATTPTFFVKTLTGPSLAATTIPITITTGTTSGKTISSDYFAVYKFNHI